MGRLFKITRNLVILGAIAGLGFVGLGDKVLPEPWSGHSRHAREQINQKLLGLTPKPRLKRPSEQREKQLEKLIDPPADSSPDKK